MAVEADRVTIVTLSGSTVATLDAETAHSVEQVKQHFEERWGYPPFSQQFVCDGMVLTNDCIWASLRHPVLLTLVLLPFNRQQALYAAAANGHVAAVRALLQLTARLLAASDGEPVAPDVDDQDGNTALHVAASYGHEVACRVLLEQASTPEERSRMLEAKSDAYDDSGASALHLAAGQGHENTCRTLLKLAHNQEQRNQMLAAKTAAGSTALHVAASRGEASTMRTLMEVMTAGERCSMLSLQDKKGNTPLHAAARCERKAVVEFLLTSENSVETPRALLGIENRFGLTALQVAETEDVQNMLLTACANA